MSITTLFRKSDRHCTSRAMLSVLLQMKNGAISEHKSDQITNSTPTIETKNLVVQPEFAFSPSAHFYGGRSYKHLISYSGFIHLEIVNTSLQEKRRVELLACMNPYVYACFNNPGKNGYFLIVKVDSPLPFHIMAFIKVHEYFKRHMGVSIRDSDMRINRLCPCILDPEMYINLESKAFPVLGKVKDSAIDFFPAILTGSQQGEQAPSDSYNPFSDN